SAILLFLQPKSTSSLFRRTSAVLLILSTVITFLSFSPCFSLPFLPDTISTQLHHTIGYPNIFDLGPRKDLMLLP
ncbi:hypothetical protein BKA67DRAFT_582894, partial [Truncatella angustata]